jgi:hypothetical protein
VTSIPTRRGSLAGNGGFRLRRCRSGTRRSLADDLVCEEEGVVGIDRFAAGFAAGISEHPSFPVSLERGGVPGVGVRPGMGSAIGSAYCQIRPTAHHGPLSSVVINLDGEFYRLRDHHAAADTLRRATTGTRQPIH